MTTLYLSISQLAQRIEVCWCEIYHRFTHSHLMNMNLAVSYPRIAFEETRIIKYLPVRLLLNTRVYFYDPICYFINFLLPTSFFPYRFKIYLTLKAILSQGNGLVPNCQCRSLVNIPNRSLSVDQEIEQISILKLS